MPRNFMKNFYGPKGTQRALAVPRGASGDAQPTRARQEAHACPGGCCPPLVPQELPFCSINTVIYRKPKGSR